MRSDFALTIQNELVRYLAGETTLDQFRQWFDSETWEIAESSPQASLVSQIELLLAEYSSGDRTEGELRAELNKLSRNFHVHVSFSTSGTTSSFQYMDSTSPTLQYSRFGREYAKASG